MPRRRWNIDDRELDALYRLTPEDFVPARDSLARALRSAGDRAMADQVKSLRRPTVGAWLVNQLVREHTDDIDELLATGALLRATQPAVLAGRADGTQLQTLTAARREQIDALVAAARDLVARTGRRGAPLDAVDATLVAATSDEAAAAAVRSGRLGTHLSYSGFGLGEDLGESVAPALRVVRRPAPPPAQRERDTGAEKRAVAAAAATEAVQEAQRAVHDALGVADDAQRSFEALSLGVDRLEADAQRLLDELASVRERQTANRARHHAARDAAKSAHADAERARAALVKAQRKLDHLG